MRGPGIAHSLAAVVTLLALAVAAPAAADLRVGDLDVGVDVGGVRVNVALLDVIPPGFHEGLQSGIAAHVRYRVELWQYNRVWRDQLLSARLIERQLAYNVVTREFKVTSVRGETRAPYATRELEDAQRLLAELRGLNLTPASGLDPSEMFYVLVHVESALGGENTLLTRMTGTAQQASRQSDYRTIGRAQSQ
jgi:hypothetical protein